nr:hypothetical protein [Tanacetum cinerariifolium]
MIAILEKSEHNIDFHPLVDFVEASSLRYTLTFKPTVYVSHIRQFWSTTRIETTEEGTKILATVDGILITITKSSLRRNLKLKDEEGINEPASPLRDVSQSEACPTDYGFEADQDRANIAKSSTLPHDSALRVTSPAAAVEGTQELEINRLKVRVKLLEDRKGLVGERSGDDAPIKGRNLDEGEAVAERVSDDTEDMATVLTSMDAATVLASEVAEVLTSSGSIPTTSPPAAEVPNGSDVVPTASLVFTTANVIDAHVARELKEQLAREDQRMSEQIARDAKVARIYVEEELQSMINGLDMSNETVAKYLSNLGWKVKDFRGMSFEEIEAKFTTESVKKLKTSEEVTEEAKSPDEVPEEKVKEMIQLVPVKEVEDLNQLWDLVKESLSNRQPTSDKEMELWERKFPLPEEKRCHCHEDCTAGKSQGIISVKESMDFMAKNVAKLIATNTLHNKQLAASTAKLKLINKELTIANAQLLATISKTKAEFLTASSHVTNIENVTTQNTITIVKSGKQADQGDFVSDGHGVGVQLVNVIAETVVEDVAPAKLQCKKKRKTKVVDAGEPSHLAKKLRGDYGVPSEPSVSGKSQSAVQCLFARAIQHVEVRGGVMPTFLFVSSSVSTTPEREGRYHIELLARANLRTLAIPQRFVIFSNSSDHSGANIAKAEVDYIVKTFVPIMTNATTATPTVDPAATAKERLFGSSIFGGDSSFAGESHPISGGFSDRTGSDFLVGAIRTVVDPDSNLQRVYVPQWNVTNGFCMDDGGVSRKMVDDSSDFFACEVANKGTRSAKAFRLHDEAQALKDHNTNLEKEKNLDVVVTSVKLQNDSLADQVHKLEAFAARLQEKVTMYENCVSQLEKFQDKKIKEASVAAYPRHEACIAKCLNSTKYLSALEAAIGKNIKKELKANKDASVEVIMNLLHLEDTLAKKLDVSSSRVRKIKENIANHVSALRGVFVPLSKPLSVIALEGTEDDYEIAHIEDEEGVGLDVESIVDEGADPFPDVVVRNWMFRNDSFIHTAVSCVTFLNVVKCTCTILGAFNSGL